MKRKIKILYVTAEISPYANAGGLGEVGRSFPKALQKDGNYEVRRVMPLYQCVKAPLKYLTDYRVSMGESLETCVVKTDSQEELVTYFIENARYYCRDNIYGYEDDGFRFFFLCMAVAELLKHISFKPDIVHVNDWHTGFLPLLLKKDFPKIKTVFTIHNISYHGFIPPSYLDAILPISDMEQLGYPEWLNFMKAGIVHSDLLTTVSPGYGDEIRQPENSYGMSSLIEQRESPLIGILNGIDTVEYDPLCDGILEYPYDWNSIEIKKKNRTALRKEYGLEEAEVPLLAMITRLDYTKGIDLLYQAISYSDLSKFQLIILGSGKPYYHGMLAYIKEGYKGKIAVDFHYSAAQAKKIYAAADIYLMPSQTEPCGLGQLYAMRYGAVCVVNPVGGLKDTIKDDPKHPDQSTGFYLEEWTGEALANAISRAVKAYSTPNFYTMLRNGMRYPSSWEKSAAEYGRLYEGLLRD